VTGALALAVCLLPLALARAESPVDLFSRANAAYETGNYAQALALYDSVALELRNADLYFNRGNAYFKLGEVGRAIADYNRAWVLKPPDKDIRHNLAFARQFRPDKTLTLENPLARLVTDVLRLLDISTVRILAGLLFLLALAAVAVLLVLGQRVFGWFAIGLGLLFLYFFVAVLSWGSVVDAGRAVVVVPELTLRSGPGAEYKEIAVVHDGLEVTTHERRSGYVLVQIPGGEGGWVETAAVEQVFGSR
jgi:tetratricopeptide (TPR) repeat protein